mgnify:CR=1 FL=1
MLVHFADDAELVDEDDLEEFDIHPRLKKRYVLLSAAGVCTDATLLIIVLCRSELADLRMSSRSRVSSPFNRSHSTLFYPARI